MKWVLRKQNWNYFFLFVEVVVTTICLNKGSLTVIFKIMHNGLKPLSNLGQHSDHESKNIKWHSWVRKLEITCKASCCSKLFGLLISWFPHSARLGGLNQINSVQHGDTGVNRNQKFVLVYEYPHQNRFSSLGNWDFTYQLYLCLYFFIQLTNN